MFENEQQAIQRDILAYCAENDLPKPEEIKWTPIPFAGEWGISTPFFQLAAQESHRRQALGESGLKVPQFSQEIAEGVAARVGLPTGFARIEAVNGYLNLYFSSSEFSRRTIDEVLERRDNFGRGLAKHERIMVEFSQPNTHKAFHVGHLRSAILGDSVARILDFAGYKVVRANYIGDIGLHVIKWLWNYMRFHQGERPPTDATRWMGDLYAEATRRLEENPDLEAEVRQLYTRWDRREPDIVALWQETRQWSIDGFLQMYETLGIHFDRIYSNSEVEQSGKQVVEDLIKRGIAEDERPEGPVIVRIDDVLGLKKEQYRVMVVLRSDSTALYQTLDLALAMLKFKEYELDRSLYVVDVRQSMHFMQVFKILEIVGFPMAERCIHLGYELVNLPGNVIMASREGTVVLLEDLIREAIQRALEVVESKNPELSDEQKQQVAQAVGLGALKYPLLARDNAKIVTFDWESALDFNGQAAPYIQYAHVRANSILRRVDDEVPQAITPTYELHPTEIQLIDLISRLPGEVQRAAEDYKTLTITNLAFELGHAFNDFYNACPVLKADPGIRQFRLRLVAASRQAIANLLTLLGIDAPQVM